MKQIRLGSPAVARQSTASTFKRVTRIAAVCGLSVLFVAACGTSREHLASSSAPDPGIAKATLAATPKATPLPAATVKPSPSPAHTAPVASAAMAKARTWWRPKNTGINHGAEFQWELDHALNVNIASDMGTKALNAAGKVASRPRVYDIDGIDNPASTVKALHARGDKVICYIEIGAAGNYYPASEEHLKTTYYAQLKAAGDLGSAVPGFPEQYINIRKASAVRIIKSMIKAVCAAKGYDAVEPDIDDSYTDKTGFGITEAQNIKYDRTLGAYAHSLGLAWGQKNGDNDAAFSAALQPTTDFLLDEECSFFSTCGIVTPPYAKAGKLVLDVEYTDDWGSNTRQDLAKFCAADASRRLDGTLFTSALAGPRNPCL
jgi:hypothetical protein